MTELIGLLVSLAIKKSIAYPLDVTCSDSFFWIQEYDKIRNRSGPSWPALLVSHIDFICLNELSDTDISNAGALSFLYWVFMEI